MHKSYVRTGIFFTLITFLASLLGSQVAYADAIANCATSLGSEKFKCSLTKNGYAWDSIPGPFDFRKWNLPVENKLRLSVTPKNLCVVEEANFQDCLKQFTGKFVLVIGDSQALTATQILSFMGTTHPIIQSSESGCPPLDFRRKTSNSLYDAPCRDGAKLRISDEIYSKTSSVIIVSGGRYTVKELDGYISALKSRGIKNILFIGPYLRSGTTMSEYIEKFKTEELITSNFNSLRGEIWAKYSPDSKYYQPDYFEIVVKRQRITSINLFKTFCASSCPIFLNNYPVLVDTHHYTLNFAFQIFQTSHTVLQNWISKH